MMEDTTPRKTPSAEVPVIDLALPSLEDGGEAAREEWERAARRLRDAFTQLGCAYVTNHGVPDDQLNRLFTAGAEFFSLDQDTKNCYRSHTRLLEGYIPLNADKYGDAPQFHESFFFNSDEEMFPDKEVPAFRLAVSPLKNSCRSLNTKISTILALGLGRDKNYVTSMFKDIDTDNNVSCFRMNYSPSAPPTYQDGTIRFGAHVDATLFTLGFQDDVGGLQICDGNGTWLNVDPMQGAILILAGEFAKIFLDDKFLPLRHRVVIPTEEPRLSLVYFIVPNSNILLPTKYISSTEAPITVKEHAMKVVTHVIEK